MKKVKYENVIEEKPRDFSPRYARAERARDAYLTKQGHEKPDPTPIEAPLQLERQEPLHLKIRRMVQQEHVRAALEAQGIETPEEADDFEIGDDFDPSSPYEHDFDHGVAGGPGVEPSPQPDPGPATAPTPPSPQPKDPATPVAEGGVGAPRP